MIRLHPAFLSGLLIRSAVIWLGVRGLLLVAALLLPSLVRALQGGFIPSIPAALAVVALTAGLTVLDGRRHGEALLLANLGVPEWHVILVAALPPACFEALIQVIV